MRKLNADMFEIGFPQGWTDNSTIAMIGPPRPTFAPNVQVNQEQLPAGYTLQQYFSEQRTELGNLADFRPLESGDRLLSGQRAEYHGYSWKIPQGVRIRQRQIATQYAGTIFTITCSCMESDWEMFEAAFEMILAGFRFRRAGDDG